MERTAYYIVFKRQRVSSEVEFRCDDVVPPHSLARSQKSAKNDLRRTNCRSRAVHCTANLQTLFWPPSRSRPSSPVTLGIFPSLTPTFSTARPDRFFLLETMRRSWYNNMPLPSSRATINTLIVTPSADCAITKNSYVPESTFVDESSVPPAPILSLRKVRLATGSSTRRKFLEFIRQEAP